MTKKDWSLLVIAAADGHALKPVQLQKALFLISKNLTVEQLGSDGFYEFVPYDYGPFCGDIYADAEALALEELVSIVQPPVTRYKEYRTTELGTHKAKELSAQLSGPAVAYVKKVVEFTRRLSFNQLVSAIYKSYPEMRVNSVFRDPQ